MKVNPSKDIGYIGFSEEIVRLLLESEYFHLSTVVWEGGRPISKLFLEKLRQKKITFYTVSQKEQIITCMKESKCKQFIMYKFRFILPLEVVREYEVFNLHPGDLRMNRGATPVIWTILLGETTTCMSLYRVSEKIDCGILISEATVDVTVEDDSNSVQTKLEDQIPDLLKKLHLYLNGETVGTLVEDGVYRRRVQERDYTINLNSDTLEMMSAKIRSQALYKGAVLNIGDKKFFITEVQSI